MVLQGKDARDFLKSMEHVKMTPERLAYLQECARQSKEAEDRGKRNNTLVQT